MERPLEGKVAVITGNSRGIGAGISLALAEVGVNIIGSHVDPNKETRANKLKAQLEDLGIKSTSVVADITDPSGRKALLDAALANYTQGIDYLILNAAGGLEQGKPANWAETINKDAQLALVDTFLPHIRPNGAVMYITSLWAHKYGEVEQLPGYEPVAKSKNMGEKALRERIPELAERNIRLLIECGHIISGTAAYTLFRLDNRQYITEIEKTAEGGKFATPEDMGRAARDLILSDKISGSTVFVGGSYAEPLKI